MSAVDVSHAIAQADLALGTAGLRPDNILRRELRASGAAVAELIAADREYDEAKEDLATQRRQVGAISSAEHRFKLAHNRRATALANIGAAP